MTINDYVISPRAITSTFGAQVFRPHYVSQWTSAGIGYVDDKFIIEDMSGVLLLEHPVGSTEHLISEDYPGVSENLMNAGAEAWPVIAAYQYFRILTRLSGRITFADTWADADTVTLTWNEAYNTAPVVVYSNVSSVNGSGVNLLEIDAYHSATSGSSLEASGTCTKSLEYVCIESI